MRRRSQILPLEETVDRRDDAAFSCQATAEAPTPYRLSATPRPTLPGPIGQQRPARPRPQRARRRNRARGPGPDRLYRL